MARVSTSSEKKRQSKMHLEIKKKAIQDELRDFFFLRMCVCVQEMERTCELLSLTYSHNVPLNQILFKCLFASPVGSTTKENNSLTARNQGEFSQEYQLIIK